MTTLRQAAQQALEALENHTAIKHPQQIHYRDAAIEALRAALAEPSDTTYLQDWDLLKATQESLREHMAEIQRLRAALAEPEQEPVVDCPRCGHCCPQSKPLTDEEIRAIRDTYYRQMGPIEFARAIEAAHNIKGEA